MFKKKPEKADYKLLCHFLRGSAAAFSLFALESEGEFMALADKFEANQATDDDRNWSLGSFRMQLRTSGSRRTLMKSLSDCWRLVS